MTTQKRFSAARGRLPRMPAWGALGLARVYTARLQYLEAADALLEVLDREPTYAPALYLLGYGHLAQGRIEDARALAVLLGRIDAGWAHVLRMHIGAPAATSGGSQPNAAR